MITHISYFCEDNHISQKQSLVFSTAIHSNWPDQLAHWEIFIVESSTPFIIYAFLFLLWWDLLLSHTLIVKEFAIFGIVYLVHLQETPGTNSSTLEIEPFWGCWSTTTWKITLFHFWISIYSPFLIGIWLILISLNEPQVYLNEPQVYLYFQVLYKIP